MNIGFTVFFSSISGISGWVLGIVLGLVPMMGWNNGWNDNHTCGFVLVIDLEQHVYFTFFGTIVLPLFLMLLIYISIFVEVVKSSRRIGALTVNKDREESQNTPGNLVGRFFHTLTCISL